MNKTKIILIFIFIITLTFIFGFDVKESKPIKSYDISLEDPPKTAKDTLKTDSTTVAKDSFYIQQQVIKENIKSQRLQLDSIILQKKKK